MVGPGRCGSFATLAAARPCCSYSFGAKAIFIHAQRPETGPVTREILMTVTSSAINSVPKRKMSLAGALRAVQPLYGTDVLLCVLLGLTVGDFSISVGGKPVDLEDFLIVPVLVVLLASPERARLPRAFTIVSVTYLIWACITLAWSSTLSASLVTTAQYIEFFFVVPLTFIYVRNLRGVVAMLNFFILLSSVLALAVILYALATRNFSYVFFLNYQKNALGSVMQNAIPIIVGMTILNRGARSRYWIALVLTSTTLVFSSSRGAILGVLVGMVVFLFLIRRVRYGIIVGAFVTAIAFVYFNWIDPEAATSLGDVGQGTSAGSRFLIWDNAVSFIAKSPYFGQGAGSYFIQIPSIGFQQHDPSNVFLLNLAEFGSVGLILFVLLVFVVGMLVARNLRAFRGDRVFTVLSASLAAVLVAHLTHIQIDVSWVRGIGFYVFACVGILAKLPVIRERNLQGDVSLESPAIVSTASRESRLGAV